MTLPGYDELPTGPNGARQAWHLFGENDQVGMLNLQSPERVAAAAGLVRKGAVFSLNVPFDLFDPALAARRSPARHTVMINRRPAFIGGDDVLDNLFPQANSQWDSLAHVSFDGDHFYNGATEADIRAGTRNTMGFVAARGIAGRGVVLDLAADLGGPHDYDPGSNHAFTVDDLERARSRAGVEYQPGDVLILHTGFVRWYSALDPAEKFTLSRNVTVPGVEQSEEMLRYLWNAHPSAIVSDTFAVEAWPPDMTEAGVPFGFLHATLIGGFGIALGELWALSELADDCQADGVYECLLVSAPLNVPGGIGSTANALALK